MRTKLYLLWLVLTLSFSCETIKCSCYARKCMKKVALRETLKFPNKQRFFVQTLVVDTRILKQITDFSWNFKFLFFELTEKKTVWERRGWAGRLITEFDYMVRKHNFLFYEACRANALFERPTWLGKETLDSNAALTVVKFVFGGNMNSRYKTMPHKATFVHLYVTNC